MLPFEVTNPRDPIQVSYTKNFPGEPTGKDNPLVVRFLKEILREEKAKGIGMEL